MLIMWIIFIFLNEDEFFYIMHEENLKIIAHNLILTFDY